MQESICDLEILKDQFWVIWSEGFENRTLEKVMYMDYNKRVEFYIVKPEVLKIMYINYYSECTA